MFKPIRELDQVIRSTNPLTAPKEKGLLDTTKYNEEGSKRSGKRMIKLTSWFDFQDTCHYWQHHSLEQLNIKVNPSKIVLFFSNSLSSPLVLTWTNIFKGFLPMFATTRSKWFAICRSIQSTTKHGLSEG